MEFDLDQLRTGLRPGLEQARAISTCSNLVADRFSTGLSQIHYAILVAELVADLQRAGISPIMHYLAR